MTLVTCSECDKQISDAALTCPHCGAPRLPPIRQEPAQGMSGIKKALLWIVGLVAAFFAFGAVFGDPQKQRAREAIERCYGPVNDPLLDIGARRLANETCRMMEADFERRFGHRP